MNLAVHTPSKSARFERILDPALRAAVFVPRLLPLVDRGHIVAWICGEHFPSRRVWWCEHRPWMRSWIDSYGYLCAFQGIDDLINATTNGQMRSMFYFKFITSANENQWCHYWQLAGYPDAGLFNGTALTARQFSDSTQGSLAHGGNVSTQTKHLVSGGIRGTLATNAVPSFLDTTVVCLYDLVLSYDGVSNNTTQALTNTLPATRYIAAGDPGLQIMGCNTSVNAGATAWSALSYTNVGGTSGHAPPNFSSLITQAQTPAASTSTAAISAFSIGGGIGSTMLVLPLQNGDSGVSSIQSITTTAIDATQTYSILLTYPLAWFVTNVGDSFTPHDFVKQIPSGPRVRDGACLTVAANINTNQSLNMQLNVAWN